MYSYIYSIIVYILYISELFYLLFVLTFILHDCRQAIVYIDIRLQTKMHASIHRVKTKEHALVWTLTTSAHARLAS